MLYKIKTRILNNLKLINTKLNIIIMLIAGQSFITTNF